MTTLRFRPRTRKKTPSALVQGIQKKTSKPWDKMMDSELFARAQLAIHATAVADAESFSEVFRGITFELMRRGYSPQDLDYSFRKRRTRSDQAEEKVDTRSWDDLTDDEFTARSRAKLKKMGITDWDTFKEKCRGMLYQLFKRELPREELGFSS